MIFIAAVEFRKENQVKKNKHGSNISNKNYMYVFWNKWKGEHYTTKVNSQNILI